VKCVQEKVVRRHDFDVVRSDGRRREVLHVRSDDLISGSADSSGENMPIFLIAGQARDEIFIPIDLPVAEVLAQGLETAANPVLMTALRDQIALCFFKNCACPAYGTKFALS
jgi:hypothetical protein